MKELTNEIVEKHGFKRINNSMWRLGEITLQNGYTNKGDNIVERIFNTKKAYRLCFEGKFRGMIETEDELSECVFWMNDIKNLYNNERTID
jgi:hypothetical protein